ncbi:MAG: hypothetical protein ACXABY_03000 [Candidatus Thorarchaeota archaeon]|jgi:hypothetical protein
MDRVLLLREQHGSVYATVLPDGQTIPWKPLPIGEYLQYEQLLEGQVYPRAILEDEIFKKCVLNQVLVSDIDKLRAGVVAAVVAGIMAHSGPPTPGHLQQMMDLSREAASSVLHELTALTCQAFPAYKPEDLYSLDYETFMLRAAQAERKLLNTGIIHEPITLEVRQPGEQQQRPPPPKPPPRNMARDWEKSQKKTVITQHDTMEQQAALIAHEHVDQVITNKEMMKGVPAIYKDYAEKVKKGEKVEIKSEEERRADALARSERNKQRNLKFSQAKKAAEEKIDKKAAALLSARTRKAKRSARAKK